MTIRTVLTGTGYPIPLALSLLVSSTSSARWRGAVEEAARLLAPGWNDNSLSDLGTLALVLHLRAQDDRPHGQIPLQEVLDTLGPNPSGEPEFVRQSQDLLAEIGEAPSPAETVEGGAGQVWLVQRDLGHRYDLSDEDGTYGPGGPSAIGSAAARLRGFLAGLDEERRQALATVPVPSGSVQIQASGGVQAITMSSKMSKRCDGHPECPTEGGTVTVDGMRARYVCPAGHITSTWTLSPAHARWALRHVGHDPASSGRLLVDGVFYVPRADESDRMELNDNVWLRHEQLDPLDAAVEEFDRPRHVHPEIPQEVTVYGAIEIHTGEPGGTEIQRVRCPECDADTGLVLRGMWGEAPWLTCPNGDTWELPDADIAIPLFKEALSQMEPLGTRTEPGDLN